MAYRPYMMAGQMKARGHEVRLLTASYSHVRRKNPVVTKNLETQQIEGLTYQFLKCFNFQGSLALRALNMLYVSFLLFFFARKIVKDFKPDIIVASSPPPLIVFGCYRMARLSGAKLAFEVRDIWPLSLTEIGHVKASHPFIRLLQFAEDFAYKKADLTISLLSNAYEHMKTRGLSAEKYRFIPNGILMSDLQSRRALNAQTRKQIEDFKKQYPWVTGYCGAHGIMNALDYFVAAAPGLASQGIGLILLGTGPEKQKLMELAGAQSVQNILFLDAIPKDEIPDFLNWIDLAYIGLQSSPLFKYGISPNKLIDYMACGKPVLMAIDCEGDPVSQSGCGLKVKAGSTADIEAGILKLKSLPAAELKSLGDRGQKWVFENLDYQNIISRMEKDFLGLMQKK